MMGEAGTTSPNVLAKHSQLCRVERKGDWVKSWDATDLGLCLPLTGALMGNSLNLSESLLLTHL